MADIKTQIIKLEEKAFSLKEQVNLIKKIYMNIQKKYLEALKKFEELILLKREVFGDRSETVSFFIYI